MCPTVSVSGRKFIDIDQFISIIPAFGQRSLWVPPTSTSLPIGNTSLAVPARR